jgi:hypothetical protein
MRHRRLLTSELQRTSEHRVLREENGLSTQTGGLRAHSSSPAARRMRLHRKRRRQGLRSVRIELHVTDIDDLIRLGLLTNNERQNPELVQSAVQGLLYRALEDKT